MQSTTVTLMISGQVLPCNLWVERVNAKSAVERTAAVADFFRLKSTQRLCGRPFLHSNDSTVVMNVKDDTRVGQKTASDRDHRCLRVSDSIDNTAAMACTVARYALEPFMADAVVARPWMCCQGHVAHGTSRLYHSVSVST